MMPIEAMGRGGYEPPQAVKEVQKRLLHWTAPGAGLSRLSVFFNRYYYVKIRQRRLLPLATL
jgi:hypothetical protein